VLKFPLSKYNEGKKEKKETTEARSSVCLLLVMALTVFGEDTKLLGM